MTAQRRQLNQTEWLDALGIDAFWIVNNPPAVHAEASVANVGVTQASAGIAPGALIDAAVPADIGDWDQLEAQIRNCRACKLCEKRKQAVPGTGDRHADWLLVGEAPGVEEDAAGLPFVGNAGKLLDAMLAALNLDRSKAVYIANAVKCRPPENRTPETAEIDACNAFLNQQIALIQPKVILALGRPAAYAVLGQEASIQSLRGSVHYRSQDGRQIPVVVTYHPAYLLRQPAEKWKAWQDLLLADATLN